MWLTALEYLYATPCLSGNYRKVMRRSDEHGPVPPIHVVRIWEFRVFDPIISLWLRGELPQDGEACYYSCNRRTVTTAAVTT